MRRSLGFTLIEILIVLAIVGLLAALAYPSYAAYVVQARRTEAQVALLDLLQQQERFYSQNNTYIAFSADSTGVQEKRFKWYSGSTPAVSAYELRGRACPGQTIMACVELSATPGTSRVDAGFRDPDCETLTLTSAGERTARGASRRCWP